MNYLDKFIHRLYPHTDTLYLSVLVVLTIPSILPFFHPGFIKTDDGDWMVIRLAAFHQAFLDGQFPVRFLPRLNVDYGYPVSNFLYPGFMYLGELFLLLGFGVLTTIKLLLSISMMLSGIWTFLWLKKIFRPLLSGIGAIVYVYAPYHIYDLAIRGSVGEVLALCVIPFLLWQIERKSFFFTTLGLGMLILSHNTLALLFFPVLFLYGCVRFKFKKVTQESTRFAFSFLLGSGLATFFWLPALYDLQYTVFPQTNISTWQEYFSYDQVRVLGIGIGIILTLLGVFSKRMLKSVKKMSPPLRPLFFFFSAILLLSLLLNHPFFGFFWEVLPIDLIQYPFRLLSYVTLAASFLIPLLLHYGKGSMHSGIATCFFFLLPGVFMLLSVTYVDTGEDFYRTSTHTTTIRQEYMPKWVKEVPNKPPPQKITLSDGMIRRLSYSSTHYSASIASPKEIQLTVNTVYFPGWYAEIDDKNVPIRYNDGLIHVVVPKGYHNVEIFWAETPLRLLSNGLSLLSLFFLCSYSLYEKLFRTLGNPRLPKLGAPERTRTSNR